MTYKQIIIKALQYFGGHAYYNDIYKFIETSTNSPLADNWQAAVRATIEIHSSDSEAFAGREDLFYAVEGLGKGHWGLRNYEPTTLEEYTQEDDEFSEGKFYLKQHLVRERNTKLIATSKRLFKEKHGRLYCQVCGFDFENTYGKLGEDFIEAHHIKPVSEMQEGETTKTEDIIMVCSNCHSMIHRRKPWLKLDEIKSLLENKD